MKKEHNISYTSQAKLDRIIILPLSILVIGIILVCIFPSKIIYFFHDDSFFYVKTAYNISQGAGSTFDGINLTNGYHPLYMGLLSILSYISPLIGNKGLMAIFLLDMSMMAVTLILIDMFTKRINLTPLSRLIVLTFLSLGLSFSDFGMESRLLLPLAWLLIMLILPTDPEKKHYHPVMFAVFGLLITATRIDAILFVSLILLYVSYLQYLPPHSMDLKYCVKRFTFLLAPAVMFLALYSLYNRTVFSLPSSISSYLKVGFPGTLASGWFGRSVIGVKARFLFIGIFSLMFIIWAYKNKTPFNQTKHHSHKTNLLMAMLNIYSIGYLLILLFFLRDGPGSWYFALPLSIATISVAYLFEQFVENISLSTTGKVKLQILILVLTIFSGALFVYGKFYHPSVITIKNDQIAISSWIKKNLPTNSRIYQVDASGVIGYLSERSVINGDGLINGWEYQEYLRKNALKEYFQKYNIEYIVCYTGENPIKVPLWNTKPKKLHFLEKPERLVTFGQFTLLQVDPQSLVVK